MKSLIDHIKPVTLSLMIVLFIVGLFLGYAFAMGRAQYITTTVTSPVTYTVTETKSIAYTVTSTITETVAPKLKQSEWNVTWYAITGEGKWGGDVGTSTFPAVFDYDYGDDYIYGPYKDYVGFKALMKICTKRYGPVSFRVGADDGFKLYISGPGISKLLISKESGGYSVYSKVVHLNPGEYTLILEYWEYRGNARISFSTDPEVIVCS